MWRFSTIGSRQNVFQIRFQNFLHNEQGEKYQSPERTTHLNSSLLAAARAAKMDEALPEMTVRMQKTPDVVTVDCGAAFNAAFATRACFNKLRIQVLMMSIDSSPFVI